MICTRRCFRIIRMKLNSYYFVMVIGWLLEGSNCNSRAVSQSALYHDIRCITIDMRCITIHHHSQMLAICINIIMRL